jgi:hypothetical protein
MNRWRSWTAAAPLWVPALFLIAAGVGLLFAARRAAR